MRRASVVRTVAPVVALLVLTGCSGSGADEVGSGSSGGGAVAPALPGEALPEDVARDEGGTGGGLGEALEEQIIRTGSLTVSVPDVEEAREEALEVVEGEGRVESEYSSGESLDQREGEEEGGSVQLTFRVQPEELYSLMEELSELGRLVQRESTSSDVSEEVADAESRIASLEASITRLRTLLLEADEVGELVAVESELTRRESELESMQARLRVLSGQVEESSLTLVLVSQGSPLAEEERGFWAGLQTGWEGLGVFLVGVLTLLGVVLPFVVVLGGVGAGAWWLYRRVRRRGGRVEAQGAEGDPGA